MHKEFLMFHFQVPKIHIFWEFRNTAMNKDYKRASESLFWNFAWGQSYSWRKNSGMEEARFLQGSEVIQ